MQEQPGSLWTKIERSMSEEVFDQGATSGGDIEDPRRKKRRKRQRALCDVIATGFWLYVTTKIFLGDVDVWVAQHLGTWASTLVTYRFFALVSILVLLAVWAKRSTLLWLVYILAFPAVVLFWKLPKFYAQRRSWNLAIGSIQVLVSSGLSIKWIIVGGGVTILCLGAIIFTLPAVFLWIAIVGLLLVWFVTIFRTFGAGVQPSRFVESQRKIAETAYGTSFVHDQIAVTAAAKNPDLEILTLDQTKDLLGKITAGLIVHRALLVLTYQLDRYRRSGAFVIFSAVSILWLLLQGIVTFGLINYALWQIEPSQYAYESEPAPIVFIYFALASMLGNEISLLSPAGGLAVASSILAAVSAGVLLLVLIVTLYFSVRSSRTDESSKQAIADLRKAVNQVEQDLSREYGVPPDEALRRLKSLGWGIGHILWLATQAGQTHLTDNEA